MSGGSPVIWRTITLASIHNRGFTHGLSQPPSDFIPDSRRTRKRPGSREGTGEFRETTAADGAADERPVIPKFYHEFVPFPKIQGLPDPRGKGHLSLRRNANAVFHVKVLTLFIYFLTQDR
jgi:hypothetical protein